jgi:hypothetical protein
MSKKLSHSKQLKELRLTIFTLAELLEQLDEPLRNEDFKVSIEELNTSIELLNDLKSTLEDNQTYNDIDYDISGNCEISVGYHLKSESNNSVVYEYGLHNIDYYETIEFTKDELREHINDGGEIEDLIIDTITNDIN